MAEIIEEIEEYFGLRKTPGSAFWKLAISIPMVADTISYVSDEYSKIKGKNQLLECFLNGIEISIKQTTSTAFEISKNVVPYEYIDDVAFKGLRKMEEKFPTIKKPTKEVWNECGTYTLAVISGIKDEKKIPKNISEAVKYRIWIVIEGTSDRISHIRCVKILNSGAHKILDVIEPMIASLKEKEAKAKENLLDRISDLTSRTKLALREAAEKAAQFKGEIREAENLSIRDLWNVTEEWLRKLYKKLNSHPKNENLIARAWRLCKLTIVVVMISIMGIVDAILPKIKHLVLRIFEIIKKTLREAGNLIKKCFKKIYRNTKIAVHKIIEAIGKIISIIKQALKDLLDDIVRIEKEVSHELIIHEPSLNLATIQPGPSTNVATIQPGPSSSVATIQPGPSSSVATIQPEPSTTEDDPSSEEIMVGDESKDE